MIHIHASASACMYVPPSFVLNSTGQGRQPPTWEGGTLQMEAQLRNINSIGLSQLELRLL